MLDRITWFKQSAYLWRGDGLTVYIDPWGVTTPDPADVIFITHAHFDHFDKDDIAKIHSGSTKIVAPRDVADELSGDVRAVRPGDSDEAGGVKFTAVPAYNIVEGREGNHPKENQWVGYILTLGGNTYYHAGDTDHVPELNDVSANVAFLPIGARGTRWARLKLRPWPRSSRRTWPFPCTMASLRGAPTGGERSNLPRRRTRSRWSSSSPRIRSSSEPGG